MGGFIIFIAAAVIALWCILISFGGYNPGDYKSNDCDEPKDSKIGEEPTVSKIVAEQPDCQEVAEDFKIERDSWFEGSFGEYNPHDYKLAEFVQPKSSNVDERPTVSKIIEEPHGEKFVVEHATLETDSWFEGPFVDEDNNFCQMIAFGRWETISLDDALNRFDGSRMKRCPECHGQVRAHRPGTNGMRAHFEHFEAHSGCSLSPIFSGTRTPHRRPMS